MYQLHALMLLDLGGVKYIAFLVKCKQGGSDQAHLFGLLHCGNVGRLCSVLLMPLLLGFCTVTSLPVWWVQAMDRAHRIGQTRPVLVFRLATAHSVEGRLLQRANSKLMLERLVIKQVRLCRACCYILVIVLILCCA